MIAQLRERLGIELDSLSQELAERTHIDPTADAEKTDDLAGDGLKRILQRRIRLLGQLVAGLACVDPDSIPANRAGYGSVVRVRDVASGAEESYTLMTGDFIDLDEGQVSLASPVGHALFGHGAGERVTVVTPRGQRQYEVIELVTLPMKLGLVPSDTDPTALQVA